MVLPNMAKGITSVMDDLPDPFDLLVSRLNP